MSAQPRRSGRASRQSDRFDESEYSTLQDNRPSYREARRQQQTEHRAAAQRSRRVSQTQTAHQATNELNANMITIPTSLQLQNFETSESILAAQLLFHEISGLGRFPTACIMPSLQNAPILQELHALPSELPPEISQLMESIELECRVTTEDKSYCKNAYNNRMSPLCTSHACASCGRHEIVSLTDTSAYVYNLRNSVDLASLAILRLSHAEVNSFQQLAHLFSETNYHRVLSTYVTETGEYYHLHPDLVLNDTVSICAACNRSIRNNIVPSLSIAAGIDYADYRRLWPGGDMRLSPVEIAVIARVRMFCFVLKVSASGVSASTGHAYLGGHIIAFPHDAPVRAASQLVSMNLPNLHDIVRTVQVVFVGAERTTDIAFLRQLPHLQVRPNVVFAWLRLLKAVNPYYRHITIDDSPAVLSQIEEISDQLFANAAHVTDQVSTNIDRIVQSDVADVRFNSTTEYSSTSFTTEHLNSTPVVDIVSTVMVTNFASYSNSVGQTSVLDSVRQALQQEFLNAEPSVVRAFNVQREEDPLSEFSTNEEIFYGAFPHLFLLGKGLPNNGTIPDANVQHMLHQYSLAFAQDFQFVFAAFNQKQRHTAARNVAARVKNNPQSFQQFRDVVTQPNFVDQLQEAIQNPDGEVAHQIVARILPTITLVGAAVPFGPIERSAAIGKLYALVHRHGIPSVFFTISPDDVHNSLAIRLSYPVQSNDTFPAGMCGESLLAALRNGVSNSVITIPVNETHLQHLSALNPVATAAIFQRIMDAVICDLLQFPELNSRKTVPLADRRNGIFGKTVAFCSVVETQGRLALHSHMAIWCTFNPVLLQTVAAYPLLAQQVAGILDEIFLASIPAEQHIRGLLRRLHRESAVRAAFEMPLGVDVEVGTEAFWNRVYTSIDTYQVHAHRATCHREDSGSCRLAKPSGLVPNTGAVQLEVIEDEADGSVYYAIMPDVEEEDYTLNFQRNRLQHPLPQEDTRCIAWELKRPIIDIRPLFTNREIPEQIMRNLHLIGFPLDEYFQGSDSSLFNYQLPEFTEQELAKIAHALLRRNGSIVEVSPTATAEVNSNTAAYFLGGKIQAKAALFYLLKYMTKDGVQLANSLSVLHSARKHIEKYPSVAANTGTTERTAQHFLLRCVNSFSGQAEVSATQAAASLLGMSSQTFSSNFIYLYIYPAIQFVLARQQELQLAEYENVEVNNEEGSPIAARVTPEDEIDGLFMEESIEEHAIDVQRKSSFGGCTIYTIDNEHIPIPQYTHYRYQGPDLARLCLYEYIGIISVKKRPTENENNNGRQHNSTFEFAEGHPLAQTYVQCIRSKQVCPILAGAPPPKPPSWNSSSRPSSAWIAQSSTFARYYLTLFQPWDIVTGTITVPLTWQNFGVFMHNLENPANGIPTFISRSIAQIITNISGNLRVNSKHKSVLTKYRTRAATQWNASEPDWSTICEVQRDDHHNGVAPSEAEQEALREIENLRNSARADDPAIQRQNSHHIVHDTYNRHTQEMLNSTIGQGNFALASNIVTIPSDNIMRITTTAIENMVEALQSDDVEESTTTSDERLANNSTTMSETNLPAPQFNAQQSAILQELQNYVIAYTAYLSNSNLQKPDPPLVFIHGGPGVGKSFVMKKVQQIFEQAGLKLLNSAFMGSAAALMDGGRTIHSLFGIPMTFSTTLPPLSATSLARSRIRFRGTRAIGIDEISMSNPQLFGALESRCREITGVNEPFGGLCVILLGDFFQLPPVSGTSLYKSVLRQYVFNESRVAQNALSVQGTQLFSRFRMFSFTQQMRAAEDQEHTAIIDSFRDLTVTSPVTTRIIQYLERHILSAQDIQNDPSWAITPIIVTSNPERFFLNRLLIGRFGVYKNSPVIVWRNSLAQDQTTIATSREVGEEAIYHTNHDGLFSYFVKGAPAYLTGNIAPHKRLANGTQVELHSLTWPRDAPVQSYLALLACAAPGEEVFVDITPIAVNVRVLLSADEILTWPQNQTLVSQDVVIPIVLSKRDPLSLDINVHSTWLPVKIHSHALELGFAITFHKVQGKTIPRVILDLNDRPFNPKITFPMLLVGLSRVRSGQDFRILSLQPGSTLQYLTNLAPDSLLAVWLAGYNLNGYWDSILSSANYKNENRSITRRQRPTRQTHRNTTIHNSNISTIPTTNVAPTIPPSVPLETTQARFVAEAQQSNTNSFAFVPFLCAVANRTHPSIAACRHFLEQRQLNWQNLIQSTRIALQNNNININNEAWGQHNYLSAQRQEFLLNVNPVIGQYLQEMCNDLRL